jgi:iron complex outermembrane receptor protein
MTASPWWQAGLAGASNLRASNSNCNRFVVSEGGIIYKKASSRRCLVAFSLFLFFAVIRAGTAEGEQQVSDANIELSPVVVTATRVGQPSFDVPASIDSIDQKRIQDGQAQVNLSESLVTVPGVVANNRQNYAQDLQISIRGIGARSTFGVRGIRLYTDGIPATMPDGQGQVSNFDLGSARSIEVLRGPFSALYGNSAGGVIQIFTEDGPQQLTATPSVEFGDFQAVREGLKLGGQSGRLNYIFDGSHFGTDGFRDHSAASRDLINSKLSFATGDGSSLTLVVNYLNTPEALDALGLTKAQVLQNPEQAGTNAESFNTRKSFSNIQGGLVWDKRLTDQDTIRMLGYLGARQVTQFLAVTPGAQIPSTSSGGVVDLDRQFYGVDTQWHRNMSLASRPLNFTAGINYEFLSEGRKGFNNFTGSAASPAALGVVGDLRRDEDNSVFNFDQYVQGEWEPIERWSVLAGVRHSRVSFESIDRFLSNGEDGGSLSFANTSPVLGIMFKARPALNVYANYGKGFETPTFNELAYQLNAKGLNFGLQSAKSNHYELGVKAFLGSDTRLNLALFKINTHNELAVLQNSGGRSVFQNVDKTSRKGLELGLYSRLPLGFTALLSYTYLAANFDSAFTSCKPVTPCVFPSTNTAQIPAGNRIPGVPRHVFYGEVGWATINGSFSTALEVRASSRFYANDTNTEYANGYGVTSWRIGFKQEMSRLVLKEFGRIDNIFHHQYVGSVIVNESNGRYYEPAPGRTFLLGVSVAYRF